MTWSWRAGWAAVLVASGFVGCLTAYVVAVSAPGASFSWHRAMLSDLGRPQCRFWYGFWVCSPRASWFNALVAGAGLCLAGAGILARSAVAALWCAALGALGAGLVLIGVVPADGTIGLHLAGGVLALPVASSLLLAHGIVAERRGPSAISRTVSRVMGALGAVSCVACLDHLAPAPAPVPRGIAEAWSVLALAAALAVTAGWLWTSRRWGGDSSPEALQHRPGRVPPVGRQ